MDTRTTINRKFNNTHEAARYYSITRKPLYREVGQRVVRLEPICMVPGIKTNDPFSQNYFMMVRGKINAIYSAKRDNRFEPILLSILTDDLDIKENFLDFGVTTIPDMEIMVDGGLIGGNGAVYDEEQPEQLKKLLPVYRHIIRTEKQWVVG